MNLYTCHRDIVPSSGVYCASFFQIFNTVDKAYDDYLITASSALHVYKVQKEDEQHLLSSVYSAPVFGKIRDIVTSRFLNIEGVYEHKIIVSLDDCKVVVVRFDPYRRDLEIYRMFNIEEGAIGRGSEINVSSQGRRKSVTLAHCPYLAVDDKGAVSCNIVYGQDLFFVPLQSTAQELTGAPLLKPFLVTLSNYGLSGVVRDIAFISGATLPTLAILQEFRPLPLGHLAKVQNTCSLVVVAVDCGSARIVVLWRHDYLPHDSCRLVPVRIPNLPDAIVIVSMNALLLACQEGVMALATTGFAGTTVATGRIRTQPWPLEASLELDASSWVDVGDCCVLGVLKYGVLLAVQMQYVSEGNWKCIRFQPDILGQSVRANCICASANHGVWFIGSRMTDSLLLVAHRTSNTTPSGQASGIGMAIAAGASLSTPVAKKARRTSRLVSPEAVAQLQQALLDHAGDMEEEEQRLYGATLASLATVGSVVRSVEFNLLVTDSLPVLGPVLHGAFTGPDESLGLAEELSWDRSRRGASSGTWAVSAAAYIAEREAKDSLQISVGADEHAALCRVSRGFRLSKLASRDFSGASAISTVEIKSRSATLVFLSLHNKTRLLQITENTSKDVSITEWDASLSGHVESAPTITAGQLTDELIVQVFPSGLRLIRICTDTSIAVQDVVVEEERDVGGLGGMTDEAVVSADVQHGWVLLLTTTETLYLLQLNEEGELDLCHCFGAGHVADDEDNLRLTERIVGLEGVACASLFYGVLNLSPQSQSKKSKPTLEDRRRAEELFLYGQECEDAADESMSVNEILTDGVDSEASQLLGAKRPIAEEDEPAPVQGGGNGETSARGSYQVYLVVCCGCSGDLRVLSLPDLNIVLHAPGLSALPSLLPLHSTLAQRTVTTIPQQGSVAVDVRLVRVGKTGASAVLSPLCLVLVLQSDDVVVYMGCETGNNDKALLLHSFRKMDHGVVTRRRRLGYKRDAALNTASPVVGELLTKVDDIDGRKGLLISGARPVLLSADHGSPFLMSLGFPELPYGGDSGTFRLCQMQCGDVRGVLTLWKDADMFKANRVSTFGIYKEVPGLRVFPGGLVTVKRTLAKCTVHKCVELLPRMTDDKTQQALLRRKTFVFACSEEISRDFPEEPMTEKERQEDAEEFDRFYPTMQSFCQPDATYGAAPRLMEKQYKVAIVQGGEVVDIFLMKKDEVILDIEVVSFYTEIETTPAANPVMGMMPTDDNKEKTKKSKRKVFVAVSTTLCDCHAEDTQGEGRLLLLDLDYGLYQDSASDNDVTTAGDPSEGIAGDGFVDTSESGPGLCSSSRSKTAPTTTQSLAQAQFLGSIQPKLRLVWSGYGPATVVRQLGDYLLSTVGPTVYLYRLVPEAMELEQVAQFYAQFYVASVSVIKTYILLADAFKSVQFIAFREADMSLNLVAKDFTDCFCMSAAYIIDGEVLGMVVCDDEGNVRILRYNPSVMESKKGFQLVRLADCHIGCDVAFLLPHRLLGDPIGGPAPPPPPPPPPTPDSEAMRRTRLVRANSVIPFGARLQKTAANKTSLVVGTMEGGLGLLVPVEERTYRRLALLQQIMCTVVESACGLNPREFRVLKSSRVLTQKKRGVLDGSLLFRFVTLDPATQLELTGAMGTTVDMVMDNLLEIDLYNSFF